MCLGWWVQRSHSRFYTSWITLLALHERTSGCGIWNFVANCDALRVCTMRNSAQVAENFWIDALSSFAPFACGCLACAKEFHGTLPRAFVHYLRDLFGQRKILKDFLCFKFESRHQRQKEICEFAFKCRQRVTLSSARVILATKVSSTMWWKLLSNEVSS